MIGAHKQCARFYWGPPTDGARRERENKSGSTPAAFKTGQCIPPPQRLFADQIMSVKIW